MVQGNVTQAAGHGGYAEAVDRWARLIDEKRVPVENQQTQDTTYVDPATRPSQRRKGPALKVTP